MLNFGKEDGLQNSLFYADACFQPMAGLAIFGTYDGLVASRIPQGKARAVPPPVEITSLYVFNDPIVRDTTIQFLKRITLPHKQNYISFEFALLEYKAIDDHRFEYRLDGLDSDWNYTETNRSAAYANLSPGSYVFRVRGINSEGVSSANERTMAIEILPPFWSTWWFMFSVAGLFAGIFGAFYIKDSTFKRNLEATRTRIARDLHDGIASRVSALRIFLEVIYEHPQLAFSDRKQFYEQLQVLSRLRSDIQDIIWLINSGNEQLASLIEHMDRSARHLLYNPDNHTYTFEKPQVIPSIELSMETRKHLLFFFQESLHNIIRHAEATKVSIRVACEGGYFRLTISDNGKGFDDATRQMGVGIKSMHHRAVQLKADFELDSKQGEGTQLQLGVDLEMKNDSIES